MSTKENGIFSINCTPLYNSPKDNVSEYYYNKEIILIWMEKILYHNHGNVNKQFLINLKILTDKIKPKINTLVIESPPNRADLAQFVNSGDEENCYELL